MNRVLFQKQTSQLERDCQYLAAKGQGRKVFRFAVGCVPILDGGKIMLISSSRTTDWILPKGGCGQDETFEESALRESYEEAGVLGFIVPKLISIQFETKKSFLERNTIIHQNNLDKIGKNRKVAKNQKSKINSANYDKEESSEVCYTYPSEFTQTKLYMFPLQVEKVLDYWPEKFRMRKFVEIDKAIDIMKMRPELQTVLLEIKKMGYHN